MTDIRRTLLDQQTETFSTWYAGKMSYSLYGQSWQAYVNEMMAKVEYTPENYFKAVIDLYAEALQPDPEALRPFTQAVVPLLLRGEAICVVDNAGEPHFPERFECISDDTFTIAASFTRSLKDMMDYVVFAWGDGRQELWGKQVPEDLKPASRDGYQFIEESRGLLYRFALTDKGLGRMLAPLQDRINHSIVDQTLVSEMYARPFWYLLKYQKPPVNPYVHESVGFEHPVTETRRKGEATRIFTSSSEGPFGQLDPSNLNDMLSQHDKLVGRMGQISGIPQFYLSLNSSDVPSGTALKQLSARFNKKVGRMRDSIEPQLRELAGLLGVPAEDSLWPEGDDLLQDAMDAHGLALTQMGYPLEYVAEVVTPGVDLDEYLDDGASMMTPDQIAAYASNPGQIAGQPQGVTAAGARPADPAPSPAS